MRILPEESLAVLIDMQEKLFPHILEYEMLLNNCLKLIQGMQILEVQQIITQQYTKGLGSTLEQIKLQFNKFKFIEKNSFSCCDEPEFLNRLALFKGKYIILFGIETHVCLLQTCIDMLERGFIPVVIEDCTGSRKIQDKTIAIQRMRQEGARISSLESILFELTRRAGNDKFKSISALIK